MVTPEQLTVDHRDAAAAQDPWAAPKPGAELAAREALKAQVAKLERELSVLVAGRFPHISSAGSVGRLARPAQAETDSVVDAAVSALRAESARGPRLLTLAELERLRDRLALRVREVQGQTVRRDELERSAREQLERMKADPARYKFVRLPVVDLGERGCGVWEVRPRLGLIGMLAGWWQLTLSSGCPLAKGPRRCAAPLLSHRQSSSASCSRRPLESIVASVRR